VVESANQQQLATAAGKDPRLGELRVFTGRSRPWDQFNDEPDQVDAVPVVNVSFFRAGVDAGASDVVERQKYTGTFHVDCYGYGVSADELSGHTVGDAKAEDEAHRALRLVRNILMSGHHTYLQLRGTVWKRMAESMEIFDLPLDAHSLQNIRGARLALHVDFNELSPQVQGEAFTELSVTVKRQETGEIILTAEYAAPDS
jgi:hypothetical protein